MRIALCRAACVGTDQGLVGTVFIEEPQHGDASGSTSKANERPAKRQKTTNKAIAPSPSATTNDVVITLPVMPTSSSPSTTYRHLDYIKAEWVGQFKLFSSTPYEKNNLNYPHIAKTLSDHDTGQSCGSLALSWDTDVRIPHSADFRSVFQPVGILGCAMLDPRQVLMQWCGAKAAEVRQPPTEDIAVVVSHGTIQMLHYGKGQAVHAALDKTCGYGYLACLTLPPKTVSLPRMARPSADALKAIADGAPLVLCGDGMLKIRKLWHDDKAYEAGRKTGALYTPELFEVSLTLTVRITQRGVVRHSKTLRTSLFAVRPPPSETPLDLSYVPTFIPAHALQTLLPEPYSVMPLSEEDRPSVLDSLVFCGPHSNEAPPLRLDEDVGRRASSRHVPYTGSWAMVDVRNECVEEKVQDLREAVREEVEGRRRKRGAHAARKLRGHRESSTEATSQRTKEGRALLEKVCNLTDRDHADIYMELDEGITADAGLAGRLIVQTSSGTRGKRQDASHGLLEHVLARGLEVVDGQVGPIQWPNEQTAMHASLKDPCEAGAPIDVEDKVSLELVSDTISDLVRRELIAGIGEQWRLRHG